MKESFAFEGLGLGFRNGYYFATIHIGQISCHLLASTRRKGKENETTLSKNIKFWKIINY
jgi:hypothetical protein